METDSLDLGLAKKNCVFVYEVRKSKSGIYYTAKTVMIRSLQTLAANSFPERVLLNTKNMINEILDCLGKNLDALKGCVCVATHAAVTTLSARSLKSVARD